MFGFGKKVHGLKRPEYLNSVNQIIERDLQVNTDSGENTLFPGALVFQKLIFDHGWSNGWPPEECAAFVGIAYWRGCVKLEGRGLEEARRINSVLVDFIKTRARNGKISKEGERALLGDYEEYKSMLERS